MKIEYFAKIILLGYLLNYRAINGGEFLSNSNKQIMLMLVKMKYEPTKNT